MPNTYTQIHIHFVFVVKHRFSSIQDSWKNDLYKYISGIIINNKHKMICINGLPDHVHLLIGLRPHQSISDLMHDVKRNSALWINNNKLTKGRFEWQEGYGAFSYGASQIKDVIKYIENQEIHHKKKSFQEEYVGFLKIFGVEYDERYIFQPPI